MLYLCVRSVLPSTVRAHGLLPLFISPYCKWSSSSCSPDGKEERPLLRLLPTLTLEDIPPILLPWLGSISSLLWGVNAAFEPPPLLASLLLQGNVAAHLEYGAFRGAHGSHWCRCTCMYRT